MRTIKVRRCVQGWMADFRLADNAGEVERLFGTYWLPTAFLPSASFDRVRREIETKNPGHVVIEG